MDTQGSGDPAGTELTFRVLSKKELLNSDYVEQCKRMEKKVFPKHEAMTATFESELKKSNTHLLIAERAGSDGKVLLGYAIVVQTAEGGQLTKLCVKENFRRMGIGSRLLDESLRTCGATAKAPASNQDESSGRQGIFTLQVDPAREGAVRLYLSRGFKQNELLKDYYCEGRDALVMRLEYQKL